MACQPSWLHPAPGNAISSTATSDPASSSSKKVPDVYLSLAAIMMCCHGKAGINSKTLDTYGCNAADPAQIRAALAKPRCKCKCGMKIQEDELVTFMSHFSQLDW